MTRHEKVLALVPHFRCERWLDHCLSSLVEQTRRPDGIVVIDDSSPEPPTDIVRRFPGVTLLRARRNVGPYRLVQQVIDESTYDWYMFQDADDWSAPDRLQRLLGAAAESGAELLGSDYVMLMTDTGLTVPHLFPQDANRALAAAPTCHALQHPTSLVRRSLIERLGGYASGLRFSGDDEFLRRAAYVTRVANVPEVLYFRRHRADSLTTAASTGHGSPARRQLLEALAARANENAAAAQRGDAPRLSAYSEAPPVDLEHLCGPPLGPRTGRRGAPLAAARRMPVPKRRRPVPTSPALVVGGPASGADALLWSLGQHPSFAPLLDVGWLVPLADAVERAEETPATRHVTLSADRALRPLDIVAREPEDARKALAAALAPLLANGHAGATWLALAPPDPAIIGAVTRLYPEARIIHVVRDADDTASVLMDRSKAVPDPLPPAGAYQSWLETVRGGLECERRAGAARVLRVRFGDLLSTPETTVARCLDFLGAAQHPACARPLGSLAVAGPATSSEGEPDETVVRARELSAALCGPPLLRPPVAKREPAPHRAPDPVAEPARSPAPLQAAAPPPAAGAVRRPAIPDYVARPAALLRALVPAGSVVAAVTKGEHRLGLVEGVEVWHFPQTADGEWAGYHPSTTGDILSHLDELQRRGAGYMLIPPWTSWWLDRYEGLRDQLLARGRLVSESAEGGTLFELRPSASPGRARRTRISVLTWNTTHNPLGRAHVLAELLGEKYDVEMVGARFDHFGTETWAPLRDMTVPLRSIAGGPFPDFLRRLEDFAATITSDVLVVSKPRLPSYLLGMLAKALSPRPLILDVDDRELTFVGSRRSRSLEDLRRLDDDDLASPYGRSWTELCESLVTSADHVTVSNEALQALFGGTIVPHARDERLFDPARFDRDSVRARFGFDPSEKVILFGGTPRRHKGVVELANALREIADPSARLCLMATPELRAMSDELAAHGDMIRVVPAQPFTDMPALLAAADLVAVLQDPGSEVSHYQMPAKISDALAMEVPCIVRRVPPLASLVDGGHLEPVGENGLQEKLSDLLSDLDGAKARARGNRAVFLSGYSFAAVRPRFEAIVESLLDKPSSVAREHGDVVSFARQRFAAKPGAGSGPARPILHPSAAPAPEDFDIVMFWKQHDTGLYGRRHDMLMRHLARSPRVRQVVQFDAPVDVDVLAYPDSDLPTHTSLLRERVMARVGGSEALPGLHQYSFVYSEDWEAAPTVPRREEYPTYVKGILDRHGVGERPVVFWVYPKNFDFPEIASAFGPDLIVADVIDDHRTWMREGDPNRERVMHNYEEIAGSSDLLFVNCESMRQLMSGMATGVHLLPNAAEYPDPPDGAPDDIPEELQNLRGPLVGYVGNLSSRIDVDLLERLATRRPDWNLVLIGSAHAGRAIAPLTRHPNVTLLGPRPYDQVKRYIRSFDVGLIPHVDDAMTRAMNPLKAFVYCALGVPVVSTDIGNLGDLRPLISVARDHDDFIRRVGASITAGRAPVTAEVDAVLRRNSWEVRTEAVVGLIEQAFARIGSRR